MKRTISILIIFILLTGSIFAVNANGNVTDNFFKANELYINKQYEECITLSQEILDADDSHMETYYQIAMSAYYTGNYKLTYETLKNQLNKNPNNELALYNAACVCSILRKDVECIEYMKRLLILNPTQKSSIQNDPDFDNVRENEDYKKMMEITVIVGGETVEFDVAPIIIDGRTLLPVRKIFECLGADVTYD